MTPMLREFYDMVAEPFFELTEFLVIGLRRGTGGRFDTTSKLDTAPPTIQMFRLSILFSTWKSVLAHFPTKYFVYSSETFLERK